MTTPQVAAATGATGRQLDQWLRWGYLPGPTEHGSGHHRQWTSDQVQAAARMARLVRVGLTPRAAAEVLKRDGREIDLGEGLYLVER